MPEQFASDKERWYWHEAQDIAWRAGAVIVERDGVVWLIGEGDERAICEPQQPERIWFETWRALRGEHPEHARSWVNGRPITPPGW